MGVADVLFCMKEKRIQTRLKITEDGPYAA